MHHNTRTYQILMLLFTVRWYWKVWWDAGRLIVTGERDEEVKTIAVWFLIPKMKESEGTLDLNVLDFFLAARLYVFDLKHSQGQAYPLMLAAKNTLFRNHIERRMTTQARKLCKLAKKKITWGSSIKTIPSLAFSRESIIKVIKAIKAIKVICHFENSQSAIQGISQCSTSRCDGAQRLNDGSGRWICGGDSVCRPSQDLEIHTESIWNS